MFEIGARETTLVGGGIAGSLEIYAPQKERGLETPLGAGVGGVTMQDCDIGGAVSCTVATIGAVVALAVNPFAGALAVLAALATCKDAAKDSAGCALSGSSADVGDGGDGGDGGA